VRSDRSAHPDRRQFLATASIALAGCAGARSGAMKTSSVKSDLAGPAHDAVSPFAEWEKKVRGRLGVATLDRVTGKELLYRADERFALCSTFKAVAVAAILNRVDQGKETLSRSISFSAADSVDYAPVVAPHLAEGKLSLATLCQAAIVLSDNMAGNLLLRELGGPGAVTAFWRTLGDEVSRLDRPEPAVNDVGPGELRDTTTPRAMRHTFAQLAFGDVLSPPSRAQWLQWLTATQTGSARLPAGLPPHWTLAHKTGTGPRGETNDVGLAWSPEGRPVLLIVYYAGSGAALAAREEVVASVARLACLNG